MDNYSMLHGFPTATPGSWESQAARTPCSCGKDARLLPGSTHEYYKTSWSQLFLSGYSGREIVDGCSAEALKQARECETCIAARKKRQRVLPFGAVPEAKLHEELFSSAPAIFSYNVPKYFAVHLRAEEFAKARGKKISWVVARDVPLFHGDRSLPEEALREKRRKWLQNHDQNTAHISGMLPLVVGMPVRLTDTIDKKRRLYRARRGKVVDWVLMDATWPWRFKLNLNRFEIRFCNSFAPPP